MYNRYKYSRTKKPEESILDKISQNKELNIPIKNTGYHNYRNYRKSANTEFLTKNKFVPSLENKNTTQEFVNKSKYRSNKTSQQRESETSKNYRAIKTNENKGQSEQVPPASKRRSYFLAPKNNIIEDKAKDYKRSSSNEKKNNNEIKDENKNENNKTGKRFFRRFNRNYDNNENKNDEKKIEINEESATSNSNLNASTKNEMRYTTGRLVNDSTDSLIKIEKPSNSNEIEVIENDLVKEDNIPINSPKFEKKRSRFRRKFNKTDDNLPQKDITKNNDDFKLDNTNNLNKRSSIATSFVPGSRLNPIKLYDNQLFAQIIEENTESSNENTYNSKINTKKKTKDYNKLDQNDIILQENDEINKNNGESDININKKEELINKENDQINNINQDNIDEKENNFYKYNNNVNKYDNKKNNQEEIKIEENDSENKDNNNEENDSNKNNMRKKDIEKAKLIDNEYIIMDNIYNEVEQFNAKTILKGDLAEIYDELIKNNVDFKDEIFFINLNHFDKKIADCDDRLVMHNFKNFPKEELFQKKYLSSEELLKKYSDRAERIKKENEF